MHQSVRPAARPRSRYNDLYAKLGISRDASPEEIQAAYRVLEKVYCPGGTYTDDVMHQSFLEISNAAAILGNPSKRRLYDLNCIDETGKLTQTGLARAARVRKAAFFSVALIAAIAGLLFLNSGAPVPEDNRKSVQASNPPQKVAAAEPSPAPVSPAPELGTKTEASQPVKEHPEASAPAGARAEDYLPPAEVLKDKNSSGASGQPSQPPAKPLHRTLRQHGPAKQTRRLTQSVERSGEANPPAAAAPGLWEPGNESARPFSRRRIAASDAPALKAAECLACLTNDRANCSRTCP
jgi:curved DNA-binding protein CbpA